MRLASLLLLVAGCSETSISAVDDPVVPPVQDDPEPAMQVEPREITFEPVAAGDRATALFQVTNVGEAPLQIVDVAFLGERGPFSFVALDGHDLEPGEAADWSVSFEPDEASTEVLSATIQVSSDAPAEPQADVLLAGSTLLPAFSLTPSSHDFGVVSVGESESVELVLENTGEAPGEITASTFTPTSPELSLAPSDLDRLPLRLQPGERVPVTVSYVPVDAPGDEATLELVTDAPSTPSVLAVVQGEGYAPDREVELFLTADDAWTGTLDGVEFTATNQSNWQKGDSVSWTLGPGRHSIAIRATDVGSVISGFIAVVKVDGVVVSRTGEGDWLMTDSTPAAGWRDTGFDDSGWSPAVKCADPGTWGTYWPKPFYDEGAEWVWWTSACRDLRQAWFRLNLEL